MTDDLAGTALAHYRLLEPLGAGAMGAVYRALDTRLERTVAIKVLHPAYGSVPRFRQRFEREARAASHLDHPHICTVYEFGETPDHRLFLALAFYPGETLAARLARGRLPEHEALTRAAEIASALHHAHLRHVVHRDVKPANVLLARGDHGTIAKMLDFGLAKLAAAPDQTHAGGLIGSPAYMAPEQMRAEFVDHRADLWSLGVVLWEMLAGERPFGGDSLNALFFQITQRPPPDPAGIDCAPAVRALLAELLASDPARRPADGLLVADRLRAALAGTTLPAAAAPASAAPPTADGSAPARSPETETLVAGTDLADAAWARGASGAQVVHRPAPRSLAILPFSDLGGGDEHFAAGLCEELIWALSQNGIRVASRSVAAQAQRQGLNAQHAARRLGVSHALEGTIRRAGDRLRITLQLVGAEDGLAHLARRFDCETRDILGVQEQIARELAAGLELPLSSQERRPITRAHSADPAAYQLFLRGRAAWQRRTQIDLRASISLFEQALERDDGYALAHAAKAEAMVLLAGPYGAEPPGTGMRSARLAAERALSLEPRLAEAHTALGGIQCFFDWDFAQAEETLRRALAVDERYATAHHWYAMALLVRCEFDAARAALDRASAIDPASKAMAASRGLVEFCRGRPAAAVERYRALLSAENAGGDSGGGFALGFLFLGEALAAAGEPTAGLAALERAHALDPDSIEIRAAQAQAAARAGNDAQAWAVLEELERRAGERYVSAYRLAQIRLALGEPARALDLLERALRERAAELVWLRARGTFSELRGEPRFRAIEHAVFGDGARVDAAADPARA